MTGPEKFAETQLPPIEAFHNTLEDEPCPVKNYNRAREIWAHCNIKTMRDYHDHYLLSDVLLLADVFENFRNVIYEQHRLDPLHFITLPSLAWASALKYTNAKLDLITDPYMYIMMENSMRGGIATISHRHARAIRQKTCTKTWLKISSYLSLVILRRPIRCTRRPITELWGNSKAKPGRLRP